MPGGGQGAILRGVPFRVAPSPRLGAAMVTPLGPRSFFLFPVAAFSQFGSPALRRPLVLLPVDAGCPLPPPSPPVPFCLGGSRFRAGLVLLPVLPG